MDIGVWGDSITYGAGDSEALGWVGRVRKEIESARDDMAIYNFGICGDTTQDLLERFQVEAEAVEPDTVIFAIGTNDASCASGGGVTKVPLEKYKENMRELVAQAKKFSSKIMLIGLTKANEELVRKSGAVFSNTITTEYNDFLKEFARQENLTFVDVINTIDPSTDLDDGLHPNAQGYEKMFTAISPVIK